MKFAPGTNSIVCEYCGTKNEISAEPLPGRQFEIDYEKFIANNSSGDVNLQEVYTVQCGNCGATTSLNANVVSDCCPFCNTALVVNKGHTNRIVKPQYLLPFKVEASQAFDEFRKWIKGLWFAPNDLVRYAENAAKLAGMYIPYWTYDSNTTTHYSGQRGDDYWETERYTTTRNGRTVTETRQVKKTRWTSVSGTVYNSFNDVLVIASDSLPTEYAEKLEPWDLAQLAVYREEYLAGFRTEIYKVDVEKGLVRAKYLMQPAINNTICNDIGGDHQRISSSSSTYRNITFKHILLPVWISAYSYNNKVFNFMINGRTGEVQGQRPYSAVKIFFFVLFLLIIAGVVVFFINEQNSNY